MPFIYQSANEGVEDIAFKTVADLADHVRYLIADRAADVVRVKELDRLRAHVRPEGEYAEKAPGLIDIYYLMIKWAGTASPGDWFAASYGGTHRIFCVRDLKPSS
jgi:hypothetical protein